VSDPNRKIRITLGDGKIESRQSLVELRQYFESTLFFRATRMENTQPMESAIGFTTEGEQSVYPLGAAFNLPIRIQASGWKLAVGGLLAVLGAVCGTIAVKEGMTFADVGLLVLALALLGAASLLLYSKLKLSLPGGE
jgi:Zn-dependent alcohol dehydrogenase